MADVDQKKQSSTEQRNQSATDQRNQSASEQRTQAASEQRGQSGSEQRGQASGEQRGQPGSQQRGQAPGSQFNQGGQSLERARQGGGLARGGASFPSQSLLSLNPRDLLTMSPFALMRRLTEDMDRMFEGLGGTRGDIAQWAPAVEVSERDGQLQICAELPGVGEEDVRIEVTDDGLVIEGERRQEREENREGYYRSERSYGHFYRLIPLPDNANIDQARAEFRNGELRIAIPVSEEQHRGRQIPISTGGAEQRRQPASQAGAATEQARRAG
jgi:HSP20 family protein